MRPERIFGVKLYALCLTSCLLHITLWSLVVTSYFKFIAQYFPLVACYFFFRCSLPFCSLLISFWSQLHRVQKDPSPPSIHNPPYMSIPPFLYFWKAVLTHSFYRQHSLYGILPLPPFYKKILTLLLLWFFKNLNPPISKRGGAHNICCHLLLFTF